MSTEVETEKSEGTIEGNTGDVYVKFPKSHEGAEEAKAFIDFLKKVKIKTEKEE